MNNGLVLPLLLPLLTAILLILCRQHLKLQRIISAVGAALGLGAACLLIWQVNKHGIQTLYMGGWAPPFGIVFVADMLAALLVLVTSLISLACLIFSFHSIGLKREEMYYYPLFQFLLTGINGSFLTGDLFNLFVCFEVMLIASYALLVLGGTRLQLRETLKYVIVNILSSALFVAAMAYLYSVVGTLNMAHLSQRVAEVGQGGMLTTIAVLLLIVFSLKAGLFLFFWLPGAYSAPPAAIRALFGGLLTKVGLYAIIRVFSLIFYHEPEVTHLWIAVMAGLTMVLGSIGAVAYQDVTRIMNYNVIIGVGFIALGIATATAEAWDGVVLYLLHDMAAKALLFILGGLLIVRAGSDQLSAMGGLIHRYPLLGWLFFGTTLALVGIPPLSGFPGKLLILRSGMEAHHYGLAAIGLASSLFVLYSLMNVYRQAFWGVKPEAEGGPSSPGRGMSAVLLGLFAILLGMGIGGDWLYGLVKQAGEVLSNPSIYIEAVMKG
ncbi:Na+/H+ antiporter subunit D [Paenibacillus sp. SYP-B4298]|uniref:Na+/H+ antiporter subunit D n=1 Tax=Paenibacillus sp. SYP-B4298 TaxID=2996034 RepID=UPI0022DD8102|nr:Na+/H+ antiporter subunit D [Paenibacillus sp. SYP-B4298]